MDQYERCLVLQVGGVKVWFDQCVSLALFPNQIDVDTIETRGQLLDRRGQRSGIATVDRDVRTLTRERVGAGEAEPTAGRAHDRVASRNS